MKLETKHLAPYLPYNLKCEVLNSGQEKEIGEMIAVYNDGSACFGNIVENEKCTIRKDFVLSTGDIRDAAK